jgi:hypothetical protein
MSTMYICWLMLAVGGGVGGLRGVDRRARAGPAGWSEERRGEGRAGAAAEAGTPRQRGAFARSPTPPPLVVPPLPAPPPCPPPKVFYHLPSLETLGIDVRADVSLALSVACYSIAVGPKEGGVGRAASRRECSWRKGEVGSCPPFLWQPLPKPTPKRADLHTVSPLHAPPQALGTLTGVQLVAVRLGLLPPLPGGAAAREVWTAVVFNAGSLAVACTTYYSLCGRPGVDWGFNGRWWWGDVGSLEGWGGSLAAQHRRPLAAARLQALACHPPPAHAAPAAPAAPETPATLAPAARQRQRRGARGAQRGRRPAAPRAPRGVRQVAGPNCDGAVPQVQRLDARGCVSSRAAPWRAAAACA